MSVVIFGGDGYLGWPLALKLAVGDPTQDVVLVDNLDRRRMVAEGGASSLTEILPPEARLEAARRHLGLERLRFVPLDVTTPEVEEVIARHRPSTVYHLAQMASAPWSMASVEQAVYAVRNNEVGNMRILWALRRHAPDAHLIKLGSFGEYAKCGLDIAEGYFRPTWRGREADRPMPYPRASDDIYHITKINDSNFIAMACRKWGLRVTDVMQSTIFGVFTPEMRAFPDLWTRFDYDAVFGTVVNRFLTQVVAGLPMTVYGTGLQRTGLMGLDDSLSSLAAMRARAPERGEHRVINHVTERGWCILEIAEHLAAIARAHGFSPRIERGRHDPRAETDAEKLGYAIEAAYVDAHVAPTPVADVLASMFEVVASLRHRIDPAVFPPAVTW